MKMHPMCHLMALSAAVDAAACSFNRASCRLTLFRSCCSASHRSLSQPLSPPPAAVATCTLNMKVRLTAAFCIHCSRCRVPQHQLPAVECHAFDGCRSRHFCRACHMHTCVNTSTPEPLPTLGEVSIAVLHSRAQPPHQLRQLLLPAQQRLVRLQGCSQSQ